MVGRGLQGQQPHQDFVFAVSVPELLVSQGFLPGLSPREATAPDGDTGGTWCLHS